MESFLNEHVTFVHSCGYPKKKYKLIPETFLKTEKPEKYVRIILNYELCNF